MYQLAVIQLEITAVVYVFLYALLSANILASSTLPSPPLPLLLSPLSSPSSTEVRYCISGRPFLTVSNAHQIPQVGGLRGLIGYNAFTYTKGLREEITFKVAPALLRTCGSLLAFSCRWKSCVS